MRAYLRFGVVLISGNAKRGQILLIDERKAKDPHIKKLLKFSASLGLTNGNTRLVKPEKTNSFLRKIKLNGGKKSLQRML